MFDLWYATGAAVMFPQLLDQVVSKGNEFSKAAGNADGKLFHHIPSIQFCDGQNPNQPIKNPNLVGDDAVAPIIKDSGFIVGAILDQVRGAIKDAVHQWFPFAPPISLYTAGKLCQIVTVPAFNFKNNIVLANKGYLDAVKTLPAKRSPNFPAFLGVLLIDTGLTGSLSGAVAPATAQSALAEFQITDPGEIKAFQTLSRPGDFMTAQSSLLGNAGEGDPTWTTCREQFTGWSPRTDAMAI